MRLYTYGLKNMSVNVLSATVRADNNNGYISQLPAVYYESSNCVLMAL